MTDARRSAPATLRNREPILAVLRQVMPASGLVLEVASGTGEHVACFAKALPGLDWQPSDGDAGAHASIAAWTSGMPNVRPPLAIDACTALWPIDRADAILCINMVHISPWSATMGLLREAGRLLPAGAPLYLYGPYIRTGYRTAPSNLAFDADLRARDPAWGLRVLEDVVEAAEAAGLACERMVEMPANNLSVVLRRH